MHLNLLPCQGFFWLLQSCIKQWIVDDQGTCRSNWYLLANEQLLYRYWINFGSATCPCTSVNLLKLRYSCQTFVLRWWWSWTKRVLLKFDNSCLKICELIEESKRKKHLCKTYIVRSHNDSWSNSPSIAMSLILSSLVRKVIDMSWTCHNVSQMPWNSKNIHDLLRHQFLENSHM